jgi:hypothetical protein
MQGFRAEMEDDHCMSFLPKHGGAGVFGVFDGHGTLWVCMCVRLLMLMPLMLLCLPPSRLCVFP